ncbi:MAG: hypothetical protein GY943_24550 [Chloroflexi bacterium]|nr:hypothetical protein [Chloroflexota bacterium]
MKFRKKPVIIDAVRFDGTEQSVINILAMNERSAIAIRVEKDTLYIPTLERKMMASIGDWIIKGIQGELYTCDPDIFDATYEPLDLQSEGMKDDK